MEEAGKLPLCRYGLGRENKLAASGVRLLFQPTGLASYSWGFLYRFCVPQDSDILRHLPPTKCDVQSGSGEVVRTASCAATCPTIGFS